MKQRQFNGTALKAILKNLLSYLVKKPDAIKIIIEETPGLAVVKIECDPHDARRVIGSKGAHFRALESLCNSVEAKTRQPVQLAPLEVERVNYEKEQFLFKRNPNWPEGEMLNLFCDLGIVVFNDEEAVKASIGDAADFLSGPEVNSSMTIIEIHVSKLEHLPRIIAVNEALGVLGKSIGLATGRSMRVVVVADEEPTSEQPTRADGRFTVTEESPRR